MISTRLYATALSPLVLSACAISPQTIEIHRGQRVLCTLDPPAQTSVAMALFVSGQLLDFDNDYLWLQIDQADKRSSAMVRALEKRGLAIHTQTDLDTWRIARSAIDEIQPNNQDGARGLTKR